MPVLSTRIDRALQLLSGYYETWDGELARELLERFRLPASEQTGSLSKGQATCLRVLFALCFRPQLLVLDEPGTGLDLGSRQRMLQTVLEVIQDPGRSVIVSSHQLHDVQRIADELLVLSQGQILKQGSVGDLVHESVSLEDAMISWGAQG
jgi:ABC-2 type transport system ATP-binding protein